ncbi:hypothetical protein [Bradyrhizobium sp. CCBAU 53338]|uniref:hypothetical protein n=1 Tax=Bradyrhizobium sp. CCBAU 53338 TaxID=1325111 RepID=UPI00188D712F|nr:hypothetical protein [Bradyrhizobium sp. CCBAU 53338]QOZ52873.1 hypothetical protein XH90_17010 [Bradyrhizobium sp. CCBAU 53338]
MNRLLSQLNRRLDKRGEPVWLQRATSGTNVRAEVPAIVRALTAEQLIGNITQQSLFIIISPTHLFDRKQWPGGVTPTVQTFGIIDPTDPRFPRTSDAIFVRGPQRTLTNVKPVFDRGECIRIELSCTG